MMERVQIEHIPAEGPEPGCPYGTPEYWRVFVWNLDLMTIDLVEAYDDKLSAINRYLELGGRVGLRI